MGKLVSIIVPAYNIEKYIGRCLESILNQTYKNLEIIVIDDGSNDKTVQIIDEYAKKDKRIIAMHKKNGGVSSARNLGLDIASGDYIGFVDGDDQIENDMYETLVTMLENENADIAHCGYKMIFPNRTDYYYNTKEKKIQTQEEGLIDLLLGEKIQPALYNKLYRKNLFQKIRLDERLRINEDLEVNYRLFKQSKKSIYYDITPYFYMIRSSSATKTNTILVKLRDPLKVLNKIYQNEDNEKVKAIAYYRYIYLLMSVCRIKETQKEIKEFKEECRKILKQQIKTAEYKKYIKLKLKVMIFGYLKMPTFMNIIYKIYDKKTGASKRYEIDGE